MAMNERGEKPDDLHGFAVVEEAAPEDASGDVVGQDDLRFDRSGGNSRRRKGRKGRKGGSGKAAVAAISPNPLRAKLRAGNPRAEETAAAEPPQAARWAEPQTPILMVGRFGWMWAVALATWAAGCGPGPVAVDSAEVIRRMAVGGYGAAVVHGG